MSPHLLITPAQLQHEPEHTAITATCSGLGWSVAIGTGAARRWLSRDGRQPQYFDNLTRICAHLRALDRHRFTVQLPAPAGLERSA